MQVLAYLNMWITGCLHFILYMIHWIEVQGRAIIKTKKKNAMAGKAKAKSIVPIEAEKPIAPKRELVLEGDPEVQLQFAHKAAKTLMSWVAQKPKKVLIRGEQYLEFGDWQILGRFYGSTVSTEWTHPIERNGKVFGYEARVVVLKDGVVISSAEGMCTRDEKRWAQADEYAIRSMAQTRTSAKALRNAFGWVAELAGMKSTPAEEMDSVYDNSPVKDDVVPVVHTDDPEKTTAEMRREIFEILKARKVDITDGKACKAYVATETQLDLVEANYEQIIRLLSN